MGYGSKNELPKEVVNALPEDPDQQLQVAQQITQIAVSGRVAKLEADCNSLRQKVAEKDAVIGGLRARVNGAEDTLAETTAKLAITLERQARLIEEKDKLTGQVNKLLYQVSKLDELKKALMKSLETSDTECGDDASDGCKPGSSSSAASSSSRGCESLLPPPMSKSTEPPTPSKRKQQGQFSCMTLAKPSPKSPAGTDNSAGCGGASRGSGETKSPRFDCNQFFRKLRSQISYEQFSEFMCNVKELNAHQRANENKAAQFTTFHPKVYSCNTHEPSNCGDWVVTSPRPQ